MDNQRFWFPGPWIGGISLVAAPLLLLAGVILRAQFHFFFPQQLAAYQNHPVLIATSYGLFAAGNVMLWPAVTTLAVLIGGTRPGWGAWGGTLAMFGLFARTHSAGVDHLAFQLVRVQNLDLATKAVAGSYGAYDLFHAVAFGAFFGWIVLAVGAYLSGTLGVVRSSALALMSALMLGTLKGTAPSSIVATAGLCLALMPLGVRMLRTGSVRDRRTALAHGGGALGVVAIFFFLGPRG
jgi:hypothetical protein